MAKEVNDAEAMRQEKLKILTAQAKKAREAIIRLA